MKFLFVIDALGSAGAEQSTFFLCKYLVSQQHTVRLVVLRSEQKKWEVEAIEAGIELIILGKASLVRHAWMLARQIRIFRPDVVQSVLFASQIRTRMARLSTRFLHVENLVNTMYDPKRLSDAKISGFKARVLKMINGITSRCCTDAFLANSKTVKHHYQLHLKLNPEKIRVIYRGRTENLFLLQRAEIRSEISSRWQIEADRILFVHAGRQDFAKAHVCLLKAIAQMNSAILDQCAFLFFGREGTATQDIKKALLKIPESAVVRMAGQVNDLYRWLAGADIFVFSSRYEGGPGSLIEAMAAGLPVVCNDLPVFREVLEPDNNAFLADVNNSLVFAESMEKMALNSELRKVFGKRSQKIFEEKFRIGQIHQQITDFYISLIDSRHRQ